MTTKNHTSPSGEDAANVAIGEREALVDQAVIAATKHISDNLLRMQTDKEIREIFARAVLPAGKVAAEPVAYQGKDRNGNWCEFTREMFDMAGGDSNPSVRPLYATPQQPAQSAEQDERGAAAWFYYEDDEFIRMYDSEEKAVAACEKFGGHWEPVFKHPARQHDRFDPYRLKVAEECCERLMSACTDAGCPDGVRMDDWIRDTVARAASTQATATQPAQTQVALTDEQREAIATGIKAMTTCGWTHRIPVLAALLAAQPVSGQTEGNQ